MGHTEKGESSTQVGAGWDGMYEDMMLVLGRGDSFIPGPTKIGLMFIREYYSKNSQYLKQWRLTDGFKLTMII